METLTIKIGKLPGRITEVVLEQGATVAQAIEVAEISGLEGFETRVNGAPATLETTLSDGDNVLLVKKIKGN